jgi:hypothetical protein
MRFVADGDTPPSTGVAQSSIDVTVHSRRAGSKSSQAEAMTRSPATRRSRRPALAVRSGLHHPARRRFGGRKLRLAVLGVLPSVMPFCGVTPGPEA